MRSGIWRAIGAYICWGLFPFYWKQVAHVSSTQVIAHRIFWSFVTLAIIALWMGQGRSILASSRSRRVLLVYAAAAVLVSANWFAYIYAVSRGFIVETSLGYFINPLVSVVLGVIVFSEQLRWTQWLAVAMASAGVLYLTAVYGTVPWIALFLAVTFAVYGVIKRLAPLGALSGLTIETSILALPSLAYMVRANQIGSGVFGHADVATTLYLAGAGMVTTLPLVLFATAVRQIPMTLIGLLQFIAPTLQLATGVLFYHEPFGRDQAIGFSGVWAGLVVFGLDGWMSRRR